MKTETILKAIAIIDSDIEIVTSYPEEDPINTGLKYGELKKLKEIKTRLLKYVKD